MQQQHLVPTYYCTYTHEVLILHQVGSLVYLLKEASNWKSKSVSVPIPGLAKNSASII